MKYRLMIDNRPVRPVRDTVRDTWDELVKDVLDLGVGYQVFRGLKFYTGSGAKIKRIK